MRLIPSTLFTRFLAIILLPMVILQVAIAVVFYERHWHNVTQHMQQSLIGEINLVLRSLEKEQYRDISDLNSLNLDIKILNHQSIKEYQESIIVMQDKDLKTFSKRLRTKLDLPMIIFYDENNGVIISAYEIKDDVVIISFSVKRIKSPTTYIFISWMFGIATLLIIISLIFMKNQLRSIINLTQAADSFGKGKNIENFKPTGAKEIISAGKAFINMKKRIERQIEYRTELLTHISHDLRTPLTRLKLQMEFVKDQINTQDMLDEINEMEIMVSRYLDFAKEEGNEELQIIDVVKTLQKVIEKFNDPRIKLLTSFSNINIPLRYQAFQRIISNLINNALKHATYLVCISVDAYNSNILITVEDDGLGIDESLYEAVFLPFNKYDNFKEGYGLGLAIAKSIVQVHGGEIKLDRSKYGGLKVKITLPN